ncbi:hypothetical protein AGMMS4952_13920 [Spirochaetia bacterium]|nr:hypothetical protein AGMMS4952_13920 [Spirochaetia bacterium]
MNMREAIKLRCLDCVGKNCDVMGCELFNKGKRGCYGDRNVAIHRYCRGCMNGNHINECAAVSCSIYQYRETVTNNLHVDFLPVTTHFGIGGTSPCALPSDLL